MPELATDAYTGASFSLWNRLARLIWGFSEVLFFRFSPRPMHAWRAFILRLWGAKIGTRCHIYPGAKIWAPWNLSCEDEVGVANGAVLYNQAPIILGKRVVISQGAHLCTGTHDYEDPGFPLFARSITVEANAWVAAECFVHPGVTIGEGAVIGARSVVTKDMPAGMVCAGHPCKPIKPRVMKAERRSAG
jgi:putative colanic acid biosynthesis acetyltransferase WcaF